MKLSELHLLEDVTSVEESKDQGTQEFSKEEIEAEVDEDTAELEEDLYNALDLLKGCLPILDRMLWFDRTDQIMSKGDRQNLMDLNAELITFLSQWED